MIYIMRFDDGHAVDTQSEGLSALKIAVVARKARRHALVSHNGKHVLELMVRHGGQISVFFFKNINVKKKRFG